jgi:hypothetical protein
MIQIFSNFHEADPCIAAFHWGGVAIARGVGPRTDSIQGEREGMIQRSEIDRKHEAHSWVPPSLVLTSKAIVDGVPVRP